jgi:hypothetical protein
VYIMNVHIHVTYIYELMCTSVAEQFFKKIYFA